MPVVGWRIVRGWAAGSSSTPIRFFLMAIPDAVGAHDDRGAAPSQDGGGHDGAHRGDGRDGRAAVEIADPAAHLLAQCW